MSGKGEYKNYSSGKDTLGHIEQAYRLSIPGGYFSPNQAVPTNIELVAHAALWGHQATEKLSLYL